MEDVLADTSAPELEATAAPAPEVTTPDEQSTEASKTFTQEELDAAIGKRLAREQRKWEREQAARAAEANRPPAAMPSADQFNSVDDYAEALATRKAEELLARRDAQKQRTEFVEAYHDREEDARNKYDDFEQVADNPNLRITDVMAETSQT